MALRSLTLPCALKATIVEESGHWATLASVENVVGATLLGLYAGRLDDRPPLLDLRLLERA
jgi:hypothetical protein